MKKNILHIMVLIIFTTETTVLSASQRPFRRKSHRTVTTKPLEDLEKVSESSFINASTIQVQEEVTIEKPPIVKNEKKEKKALKMADKAIKHFDILINKHFNPGRFGIGVEALGTYTYPNVFSFFNTILKDPLYTAKTDTLLKFHRKQMFRGLRFIVYHLLQAMQDFAIVRYNRIGDIKINSSFKKQGLNAYWQYIPEGKKKIIVEKVEKILNNLSSVLDSFFAYSQHTDKNSLTYSDIVFFTLFAGIRQQSMYVNQSNIGKSIPSKKAEIYTQKENLYVKEAERLSLQENSYKIKKLEAQESMASDLSFISWLMLFNFLN